MIITNLNEILNLNKLENMILYLSRREYFKIEVIAMWFHRRDFTAIKSLEISKLLASPEEPELKIKSTPSCSWLLSTESQFIIEVISMWRYMANYINCKYRFYWWQRGTRVGCFFSFNLGSMRHANDLEISIDW